MAMADDLAGGRAGVSKPEVINHVVQAGLQNLQHLFTGHTAPLQGSLVNTAKLPLHQPVVITQFLFLDQAQAIFGVLAP
jgi:hypothetical protein